jgi:Fe-S oxidoreductase/nitrate reductase gamma subunit
MSPIFMAVVLLVGWGAFAYSVHRRWKLMMVGAAEDRSDQPGMRLRLTVKYALAQLRMRRYPPAGFAHMLIFSGFIVLLLRTLILWGRGFDESFSFWLFGPDQPLGKIYSLIKDVFVVLVLIGSFVFVYYRMIKRLKRMTLSTEGLVIIWIIVVMMFADVLYDAASISRRPSTESIAGVSVAPVLNFRSLPENVSPTRILARTEGEMLVEPLWHSDFVDLDAFETKETGYWLEPDSPLARNSSVLGTPLAPIYVPGTSLAPIYIGSGQILPAPKDPQPERTLIGAGPPGIAPPRETPLDHEENNAQQQDGLRAVTHTVSVIWYEPVGCIVAVALHGLPDGALAVLQHLGFWTHVALVLIFLNLLPYSKHFHVITAIPNVYAQSLYPAGRLPPIVDIEGWLEREETLGIKRIDQFSWKSILDFYTCTECGRCSDYCPATNTGKKLSPKHFLLDLRDFLYKHKKALVAAKANGGDADGSETRPSGSGQEDDTPEHYKDLVDGVIDPEVLWACTTCRACEQECPVFITFVDKIVDMRRYLVQERGEFPKELQTACRSLESTANPWGFPADDRGKWAEGLDVKTLAEHPDAEVIFWVGCAPSFDERAKKVTRATAQLMQKADVDFAILGSEEQCTGDPARRAGNEYLFQTFARQNIETLNRYGADKKKIVTTCPHCFNTLLNEYADFGGKYDVIHHSTFLAELVQQGRLKPTNRVDKKVVYHDSCYLGRFNEVYDAPRDVLKCIPGLTVLEPTATRDRGMCCGAGGAQMFKEEEPGDQRVSAARTQQLLDTNPDAVSSACPFCMRMLTDGLAEKNKEDIPSLDIAEILLESVEGT